MEVFIGSLERKLQRPLLAKSRTLPSIPQSPTVARVLHSDLVDGSPPRRIQPSTSHPKACTLPPADEAWRLEDDEEEEGEEESSHLRAEVRPRSQSPFSHFRSRAAYLRKSVSVDDHLGMVEYSAPPPEGKGRRGGKGKLKRKFSLGSADRKEAQQKKPESGISKFTQRLSLKDRQAKPEKNALDRPPSYRRRSLSLDWAESSKMTQQMREHPPAPSRKSASLSSPSAARRLYRNLSGKFRVGNPGLEDSVVSGRGDKERLRKSAMFQSNEALFEAVEHQELDLVQLLLSQYSLEELDLNTPNSEGLLPLDIAIMTNNVPMAKLLLQAGAKESPHFVSLEGRAVHLATLVREAEQRAADLAAQVASEGPGDREASDRERQLKAWEWRHRLFKRMQTGFEHARPPDAPSNVRLSVGSNSSLRVTFQEPLSVNSAVVTRYKVSWSCVPSMCPLLGEIVVEDTRTLQCTISGLASGTHYYVQVCAYNMKGWGPPQSSVPACAAPSSWREIDGREPRQKGQKEALDQLLEQIKDTHRHCVCHEQCKAPAHARKHSVSKSLRHLFQPTSKFVKSLKRGLYLTSIFYRDDNVLVTPEDQIPIVEIEDSYSSSLMQDFLWFTKVSYLWEEISWLQQCLSPSQSSCSCALQTRLKTLQAVSLLQGMLGTQDLGRVYFEPIKDKHGNVLLVTLRDMSSSPSLDGVRWTPLCKLQLQRKSISSPEEPTALDMLLITLHEKLAYHRRSRKQLSPGLYLGYLKLCSSVDQIRVLVPQKLPNVLCHVKVRDNSNVSREEWQWLQALSCLEESLEMDQDVQSAPHRLLQDLRSACKELIAHINIPVSQAQDFRIYSQEVLEFGEKVSFLLLLPPSDDVCTAPGQNNPYSPRSGFLTLPLQVFELVHFDAYCQSFIGQYCRVSALLELESLMSQQNLREAFSESELLGAKQKHQQVQEHIQQMEEVWREARWIMDALQYARYKQPSGGISVGWIIDFSRDVVPEKPPSTSSQLDYLPSPMPSPETSRKHNSDFHGLSDEEGSSEVFLTTDSDYDSSRAQSPRELDLLPSSPCSSTAEPGGFLRESVGGVGGGVGMGTLRDSTPDVLQASELSPGEPGERRRATELFDSDFILPSRQIELLRITEKRQAFCVRTSSLEFPSAQPSASPASSPHRRWHRPSSVDRCCPAERCHQPPPARTLSEDSGSQRFSEPQHSAHRRGWHVTLRVYPQYRTGLPKETSVKLRVTQRTSAREMVRLVVQEMNEVSQRLLGSPEQFVYREDQLEHFGLVLVLEDKEKWLQDDFRPLELQNPWLRGRLCVRVKEYSPLALQFSRATTV
ncbi:ankyrin repeat and fibronectin type-III domain-containing protein 1 isoform X2 [Anguilla anguilla]|uniref:ankyrin repeat and fibronectin type-III domain-containing protein 1 isoform X2 n=1 Tax=Anguilla anguilla TaxID=7936 RepID=UPI0015B0B307|nr:ankyrin repeat and fibronectin type-III domain-containing protein 1 isoform X2 [Anguilla anguilla]XP_035261554.1 ankyrin repeat and fibronectin type-III domain-containing protein 1 isoform X2 [Anguilla anguilla]